LKKAARSQQRPETLKSQPLALALVVINVLFLAGGIWIMHDIADSVRGQQLRKEAADRFTARGDVGDGHSRPDWAARITSG
jgi:hypothetical protein